MLVGGLWHGAAWKFVFWGAMHGVGLMVHKACRPWLSKIPDTWPVKALSWSLTMLYVSLLFIFFRANSLNDSWLILKNIFTNFSLAYLWPFVKVRYVWLIMMIVIVGAHCVPKRLHDRLLDGFVRLPWALKLLVFVIVVQCVIEFMTENVAPFIYFQF